MKNYPKIPEEPFFFEALFALQRPRVLGAVIMSRRPITPPKRGQLCKGDRRVLAG